MNFGHYNCQKQINQQKKLQDQAYSYGITGNVFSALECYANRHREEGYPNSNIYSYYNNFDCGNKKDLHELKMQIIAQLEMLNSSYHIYRKEYGTYNFSENLPPDIMISQLETWKSWVPLEDRKYYDSAIAIIKGKKPQSYQNELGFGSGYINPCVVENAIGAIHKGNEAIKKQCLSGYPSMVLNSSLTGNPSINMGGNCAVLREQLRKKIDKQFENIYNLCKKKSHLYYVYLEINKCIPEFKQFIDENAQYYFRDDPSQHSIYLKEIIHYCKSNVQKIDYLQERRITEFISLLDGGMN